MLSQGASLGFGDRPNGVAAAFIAPSLLADREAVTTFLECLGLFVVCRHRRATLHAAAICHNGRCLLLTGHEGAGKSTLAYACLRSGFRLVADDIVFADEAAADVRIYGQPWNVHLLPDAVRFFPELNSAPGVEQLNGEKKLRVSVRAFRPDAPMTAASVWAVCELKREGGGSARLGPANADTVLDCLTKFKEDPMLDQSAMHRAAERLLQTRLVRLEIGEDPLEAAQVLRGWLENDM